MFSGIFDNIFNALFQNGCRAGAIDAVFSPSYDSNADSCDAQDTRFRHEAAVRAHAMIEGEDTAILAGIGMTFADRITWRIPQGRTPQLSWSSTQTTSPSNPHRRSPPSDTPSQSRRCPGHH
jgi:hypothetical protein